MTTAIVQKGDEILRSTAKTVPVKDIGSKKIQNIIQDMKDALALHDDGVAIAAPQIGISLRIFVVSGHVFDPEALLNNDKKNKLEDLVFINPKIIKQSKKKEAVPEGCLSVRYMYGDVRRSTRATVQALDENGKKFTRGASGLLAQIFQHEIDHLNGILFTDKAKDLQEIPPEKISTKGT